ncbi:occludin/ELL domain-containing protein 1 isoform X2 [Felis catus]|uniref:occludin/ELL domain-containing protein 1 isoform X2 n=1 Tax=Felis catus TaxID=9685 RepID=UPI001D19D4E1|nr:occludin/ELL domain-containing protein 1 isoform X2 [Felis catus]
MHNRDSGASPGADPGSETRTLGQAARRPPPPRAGRGVPRKTRPPPQGRPSGASPRRMPTRESPKTRGYRGDLQTRPPGPGPPRLVPPVQETSPPRALCEPQPGAHRARPKKIVFEDELPSRALLGTKKPIEAIPGGRRPRPHPVPDYELLPGPVHRVLGAPARGGLCPGKTPTAGDLAELAAEAPKPEGGPTCRPSLEGIREETDGPQLPGQAGSLPLPEGQTKAPQDPDPEI